jgi:hypothetical protein
MTDEVVITDISEDLLDGVLAISHTELGIDYQDKNDFLECVNNPDRICKVALVGGKVAGFSICKMFGPDEVDEILKLPDCDDRTRLMSLKRIGLFDSMSIDDSIKGRGIGTKLGDVCLDGMLDDGVQALCGMAWKSINGTTNAKRLLEKMGLSESISIQGYWNKMVSSPEGHHCPHCGAPCRCFGVLYVKYL